MNGTFINVSLPTGDLMELYRALLSKHVVESMLRREHGLEAAESPSLARLEQLLNLDEETAHALFHELEDELWEYCWYAYTDEWAWHRAEQDVTKKLGEKMALAKREAFERMVEEQYDEAFDRYASEIDMRDTTEEGKKKEPQRKQDGKGK